ncbi:hypothetical protein QCM80_02530 [Bradyrhizobium sp. SSUT112]|uniref:hypothetical protein n=1 Tax=Bradyrhizobium sp. SSUT112 TaxID=3040604 RepID=UPI00244A8520|nr:hypothetical protein [Bradyrhizobium sp. SSUT112]MDH2349560.1 hypothetical protein [Bradyrhizobium sp. SSUT112]
MIQIIGTALIVFGSGGVACLRRTPPKARKATQDQTAAASATADVEGLVWDE